MAACLTAQLRGLPLLAALSLDCMCAAPHPATTLRT
jgi:hypothetical protein